MAPPDIRRTGTSRRAQYNRFTGYVLATAGAIVGAALLGISLWQPRSFSGPRNLMHDAATNRHLGYGANLIATMTPGLYGMLVTLDELIGQCCGNGPAVSGVLPNVGGIPHFWSEHMPMTDEYGRVQMSAPGVPDVAANIYHSYQLLNLDSFIRGEAAGLELIVEMDNDCEKIKPILRWREVLGRRSTSGAAGGIEGIAGITGISLS